jgi:hypothetical protein
MSGGQDGFAAALLDPARPAPDGLTRPGGAPAGRRFDVYRNNVASSLIAALETAFPALRALLGDAAFRRLATAHARRHPPRGPRLMLYGADMPEFLAGFPPLRHLAYLPDLARLELARRQSYHAADAAPVAAETFAALPPARLLAARLTLAPAVRLIRSRWPVGSIWQAATDPGAPRPGSGGENVLVTRPAFDPVTTVLAPGGGTFVAALTRGDTLGQAVAAAEAALPGFEPTATLGVLAAGGAITAITEDP